MVTTTHPRFTLSRGFREDERPRAAALFWEAFQGKLGPVMRPDGKALAFFAHVADPDFAVTARAQDGEILGLAGFKTSQGALMGGRLRDLLCFYGWLGTAWRAPLLALLERELEPDVLLMDGIFTTHEARGQGIGTALLDAIANEASARGLARVRLDVIDNNPRARALYERQGFVAKGSETTGPLRHIFGFRSATRMERPVAGTTLPGAG